MPVPFWRTLVARPLAVFLASLGAAATSAGAGIAAGVGAGAATGAAVTGGAGVVAAAAVAGSSLGVDMVGSAGCLSQALSERSARAHTREVLRAIMGAQSSGVRGATQSANLLQFFGEHGPHKRGLPVRCLTVLDPNRRTRWCSRTPRGPSIQASAVARGGRTQRLRSSGSR